jgi:hypothetical protein
LRNWPPEEVWRDFVAAHEGDWESASAVFGPDSAVQPLPERFIPPAFTEWGQTVTEWQGVVRVAAVERAAEAGAAGRHLACMLTRFWPTVGCEYGKARVRNVAPWWRAADALRARAE